MDIAAIIGWITANGSQIIVAVLSILGGFSIIAKMTPTQADDKVIDGILKFIQVLGLKK
jgi:hypothetical protein